MNILILGGKGQLAGTLIRALKKGETALGNLDRAYVGHTLTVFGKEEVDITNVDQVVTAINEIKPNLIFNCAAMADVDGCQGDWQKAMAVNAIGARNVAVAADGVGAKNIYISTDYVFDGQGQEPYQEWDTCNPQTIYGKSKHLGESYTACFCKKHFIVRTAWLYGHEGKNFVKTITALAQREKEIKVVKDQIGCPTNAEDLVHHLLKLALTQEYGLYHCAGKGACSWWDFATEIVNLQGLMCKVTPCTTAEFPRPAKRPHYSVLDGLMLTATIGNHMRPWQEALKDFICQQKEINQSVQQ